MTKFKCAHHKKRIGIDVKNNNKPIYFPFCCHLWRPRPPWLHFLPVQSFLLVLCPSWVMDYLSAISQHNHIQRCSSSFAVCFKDDASLHFLFAPSVLLHGIGVSSIDFQLFSLWLFTSYHWGLSVYSWPEICILKLKWSCEKCVFFPELCVCCLWMQSIMRVRNPGDKAEMKDAELCCPETLAYTLPFTTLIAVC